MGKENSFRKTTAYTIFLGELREQLNTLEELQVRGEWTEEEYLSMREQFHKVRGSAGLFGHDDVGGLAYKIEQKLLSAMKPLHALRDDLRSFQKVIRTLVSGDTERR